MINERTVAPFRWLTTSRIDRARSDCALAPGEIPGPRITLRPRMLFGRDDECARIDGLLDAARARQSSALVMRGEAGIGKTALLEYAAERATGFRVLRTLGIEAEGELGLAGAQQLL